MENPNPIVKDKMARLIKTSPKEILNMKIFRARYTPPLI